MRGDFQTTGDVRYNVLRPSEAHPEETVLLEHYQVTPRIYTLEICLNLTAFTYVHSKCPPSATWQYTQIVSLWTYVSI
jgi:hypothetical protein